MDCSWKTSSRLWRNPAAARSISNVSHATRVAMGLDSREVDLSAKSVRSVMTSRNLLEADKVRAEQTRPPPKVRRTLRIWRPQKPNASLVNCNTDHKENSFAPVENCAAELEGKVYVREEMLSIWQNLVDRCLLDVTQARKKTLAFPSECQSELPNVSDYAECSSSDTCNPVLPSSVIGDANIQACASQGTRQSPDTMACELIIASRPIQLADALTMDVATVDKQGWPTFAQSTSVYIDEYLPWLEKLTSESTEKAIAEFVGSLHAYGLPATLQGDCGPIQAVTCCASTHGLLANSSSILATCPLWKATSTRVFGV